MEVLVRCEPSGVTRLLATSKALTNIANENETTIYCKLYHNLLVKNAVGAHVIHSPVWRKGKASISYPLSASLPAAVVYSWKVHWVMCNGREVRRVKVRNIDRFPLFSFADSIQEYRSLHVRYWRCLNLHRRIVCSV